MKVKAVVKPYERHELMHDIAKVYKHGENDFSVYFVYADYSVRGTYEDVQNEIAEAIDAECLNYESSMLDMMYC